MNPVILIVGSAVVTAVTQKLKKHGIDPMLAVSILSVAFALGYFVFEYVAGEELKALMLTAIPTIAAYSVAIYEVLKKFIKNG